MNFKMMKIGLFALLMMGWIGCAVVEKGEEILVYKIGNESFDFQQVKGVKVGNEVKITGRVTRISNRVNITKNIPLVAEAIDREGITKVTKKFHAPAVSNHATFQISLPYNAEWEYQVRPQTGGGLIKKLGTLY